MGSGAPDGRVGNRRVLCDLTNNYRKRPLPLAPEKISTGEKIGRYEETPTTGVKESNLKTTKRVASGNLENPARVKENIGPVTGIFERVDDSNGKVLSFLHVGSDASHDVSEAKDLLNHNFQLARGEAVAGAIKGDESKRSCITSGSMLDCCDEHDDLSPELEEELQEDSETDSAEFMTRGSQTGEGHSKCVASNESKIVGSVENKSDGGQCLDQGLLGVSMGFLKVSTSPSFKMADLDGLTNICATISGDSMTNAGDNIGPDKACSCAFCLKAAFMWTDLHYQDTRGRLAALKKSRRYARTSEGRCYGQEHNARFVRDNSRKSTKLEFNLMQQWRSLFRHTEDVLVRESAQLHSALLRLKELRENCKRDLEIISMVSKERS